MKLWRFLANRDDTPSSRSVLEIFSCIHRILGPLKHEYLDKKYDGYFDGFNINLIVLIDHQIICKHVGEVNRSVPLIKARHLLSNNGLRLKARTRVIKTSTVFVK